MLSAMSVSGAIDLAAVGFANDDINGQTRPVDGNLDGIVSPDLGADESCPHDAWRVHDLLPTGCPADPP